MGLDKILLSTSVKLKRVVYQNDYASEYLKSDDCAFSVEDTLSGIHVEEKVILADYKRDIINNDKSINIQVVFEFHARIKDECELTDSEIINVIEQNKNEFVFFIPAEASILISNISKSAKIPPIVSSPEFIE